MENEPEFVFKAPFLETMRFKFQLETCRWSFKLFNAQIKPFNHSQFKCFPSLAKSITVRKKTLYLYHFIPLNTIKNLNTNNNDGISCCCLCTLAILDNCFGI